MAYFATGNKQLVWSVESDTSSAMADSQYARDANRQMLAVSGRDREEEGKGQS
jgi:hypothetical protein